MNHNRIMHLRDAGFFLLGVSAGGSLALAIVKSVRIMALWSWVMFVSAVMFSLIIYSLFDSRCKYEPD